MTPVEYLSGLWAFSLCFWGLYGVYTSIRMQMFIVKRYEKETDLLKTICFMEHFTFTRYLPNNLSGVIYGGHLLMCVWGWWFYGKRKIFRDIQDPSFVTQHFTKKEIRRVKRYAITGLIVVMHGIAYVIFRFIWPEAFA